MVFEYFQRLLQAQGMAPHGYCLLWQPELIWTHIISDALIGLAYFSIPIALARFLTQRRDVEFGWMIWMFAIFIMACGTTHFFSIWTLWRPDYGVEALVKAVTALVSVITAIALWPLLPKAIAIPSPAQLQRVNSELSTRIDERDQALAALERETAERVQAEELLRQAQKMEAVGQLTGGIAHDFNNLLTIIVANVDRARRLGGEDEALARLLTNAIAGAERAAELTDRLLAFSRKQPLVPQLHDLNAIIRELEPLLERAMPTSIERRLDLGEGLPPVLIDRNQFESTLLNLAINARDAMPDGGVLTIRTSRGGAPSGDGDGDRAVVVVEVIDSGTGMAEEIQGRAFEPFFTTKPLGVGTGLGLSQAYGFTKQSGGDIAIRSNVGEGTMIRLILPAEQD